MLFKTVSYRPIGLVILGGFFGTILRYALSLWLPHDIMPWGTLVANLLGCFILGAISKTSGDTHLLLGTGFCSSLTTMSAFAEEAAQGFIHPENMAAGLYIGVSVIGGLLSAILGSKLTSVLPSKETA